MKLQIAATIMFLLQGAAAQAQDCGLMIRDGGKINVTAFSWTNPHIYDPKFQKLKDEKKDELIAQYNADVASGKIAPASTYPMSFAIKKAAAPTGGDEYTMTTNIAGKDYSSYLLCKDDTIYSYRNKGVAELPDGKGGSLGFTIQSLQKLPKNIKVGDELPRFDDISFLYPQNFDTKMKVIVSEPTQDAGQIWTTYQVKVRETFSFSGNTLHYVDAKVTGEEEVSVGGNRYKALIIESQTWNKGKMDASYETAYTDLNKKLKEFAAKAAEKAAKAMVKKQFTNELGYMVRYQKEWYVPGIGIVKSETYDNLGGIAGGMNMTSLD